MEKETTYYSSGKFLMTSEYLILEGAKGLALPLKFGQTLNILPENKTTCHWTSFEYDAVWFECEFDPRNFSVLQTSDNDAAERLMSLLKAASSMNPSFKIPPGKITVKADFNLQWGLGSSSTLVNNIASFANIDPFVLLDKSFGGSGYDIACASAKGPITYQIADQGPLVNETDFKPPFAEKLFFVYLGKKMNSRTGMKHFRENANFSSAEIEKVNSITDQIISTNSEQEFQELLGEHESLLSKILGLETIKSQSFPDYPYLIKSLGAWGGDFVLVFGDSIESVSNYFLKFDLETIFPYKEIVLSNE